jgi:hypothetical protein
VTEPGRASFEHLRPLLPLVAGVPGDFLELGVWRGATFVPLARAAAERGRVAHAVDSFEGMLPPSEKDRDEKGRQSYPAGALSAGGTADFERLVAGMDNVRIHAGFVPPVLRSIETPAGVAFAHVDLDQYLPTRLALEWLWTRANPGGLIVCHDYWPGRRCLAALAIDEFRGSLGLPIPTRCPGSSHAWFRKGAAA